jgi:hypothetical protein
MIKFRKLACKEEIFYWRRLPRPLLGHTAAQYDATVPILRLPAAHLPQEVEILDGFRPFEVHVVPQEFALYWTLPNGRAKRYSVRVGRVLCWWTSKMPSWRPTPAMIRREPNVYKQLKVALLVAQITRWRPGRCIFIVGSRGYDASYPRNILPETLCTAVFNVCARLVNDQLIEFYEFVSMETKVVLYPVEGSVMRARSAYAKLLVNSMPISCVGKCLPN